MRRPTRLEMILVVVASLLFLASTYFSRSYGEARGELALLARQVATREAEAQKAQVAITLIEPLQAELEALNAKLSSPPEVHFPRDADTVALVELAASAGRQSGARLLSFENRGVVRTRLSDHDYMMHRYEMKAQGQPSQLGRFIASLEAGSLGTLVIESGSLSAGQGGWDMILNIALFTQAEPASEVQ